MAAHRYAVGDRVELQPAPYDGTAPRGAYTIVRQLPNGMPDREYRVKSASDGHERVVQESRLVARAVAPVDRIFR